MSFLFLMSATIGGINIFYIIISGMAPGAPGLKWGFTRFFLYAPGPGFFLLIGLFLLAITLRSCMLFVKDSPSKLLLNRISWGVLIILLLIEGLMIADFSRLF